MKNKKQSKKGQVWVETVIYTLIGLVLIGTVLAFATPLILEQKDKATIENTAAALQQLDNEILTVKNFGIGNARNVDFFVSEGTLEIDGSPGVNKITFTIDDSRYQYSEPGFTIDIGGTNIKARTTEQGKRYSVEMVLNYEGKVDITYSSDDQKQTFGSSPNPYRFSVKNEGKLTNIDCPCPPNTELTCNVDSKCERSFTNVDIIVIS